MPFKSRQQQKWAHTENGKKALGGEQKVHEWDLETKKKGFSKLKELIKPKGNK